MIIIDYFEFNSSLGVKLDLSEIDWDEASSIINFIKKNHFKWDAPSKTWFIKPKYFAEFSLKASKKNFEYKLSPKAEEELNKFISLQFPKETQFFRSEVFNDIILTPDTQPFNFQKEIIDWQISRSRSYNSSAPGLGKSFMTIATTGHWFSKNKIDGIFVIVPNGLSYHWEKEYLSFLNLFQERDIIIINNSNKNRIFESNTDKKIIITPNHIVADIFASYRFQEKKKKMSNLRWDKSYVDVLKAWNKKSIALVSDEHHGFKNPTALKTKVLKAHLKYFSYRIFLTATPAINAFEDWFNQLEMLDPGILKMDTATARVFVAKELGDRFNPNAIVSYDEEKVQQIKSLLKLNVIRKNKADLPEMKTKQIVSPVYFALSPQQKILSDAIYNYYSSRMEEDENTGAISYKEIFIKFPYAVQVLDNVCLLQGKLKLDKTFDSLLNKWKFEDDPRIEWLDDFLKYKIEQLNEKVVLYDIHPLTLQQLKDRYSKYDPLLISGAESLDEKQKQQIQNLFNDKSNSHKLLLLSFATSSSGLNLQYGGNTIIMLTLPSDATLYRQALDRQFRINSEKDSEVKICVFDKSFDIVRYNRCINRAELNDTFLTKKFSKEELSNLLHGI